MSVIYGGDDGLDVAGHQVFSQAGDVLGIPEENDGFGSALAAGDFDGDGIDDLAIGIPGEQVDGAPRAGKVQLLFGSSGGLTTDGQQKWTQSTGGVPGLAQKNDKFGTALAAGDFDDDGYSDLAIGAPKETVSGLKAAGSVTLLMGSSGGLTSAGSKLFKAGFSGLAGVSEIGDRFGASLRKADLNGDGHDDLAVGVPGEDLAEPNAGAVIVIYGRDHGLVRNGSQVWHQDIDGVEGEAQAGDALGVD